VAFLTMVSMDQVSNESLCSSSSSRNAATLSIAPALVLTVGKETLV